MKNLTIVLALASLFGASACATTIPVKIRRAPELNLVGVRTLEVKPFDVSGNLDIDMGNTGGGLVGAVADLAVDTGVNKLAERKHKSLREQHHDGLERVIVRDGYYKVADKAGDARLEGAVVYEVEDQGEAGTVKEKVDNKDVERKIYTLTRRARVTVRVQVVGKNGDVLGSSEVASQVEDQTTAPSRDQARSDVAAWDDLVRDAIAKTQEPTLKKIAPYFVTERRTLAKGDSDVIVEGNKAAAQGHWDQAAELWKTAGESGTGDDKLATTYNLGVYAEVEGRLDDALKLFEEAKQGDGKYAQDVARVKKRIREEEQIRAARTPASAGS